MKIAGIILSILVLVLNAAPCCVDYCSDEEAVENHSGSEGTCSPFLSCGSCTGFVLQEELPVIIFYSQPSVSEIVFSETQFQSDFSEAIWQPPRFLYELPLS